jgi:hypothetical protein
MIIITKNPFFENAAIYKLKYNSHTFYKDKTKI